MDPDINPRRKRSPIKDSTITSKKSVDKRSSSRSIESKSRDRDDKNKETRRKSFTFKDANPAEKSSSKNKERPVSLNVNEKKTETNKLDKYITSEEPQKEELNDFIYENKQYTCIYCPISFHPLKSRALTHARAAKHKKLKIIALEKRSEVNNDTQNDENTQDDIPSKHIRPAERSNDRHVNNSPAPEPAPAPARKRGRTQRTVDQPQVPSSELDFEEEPAAKRGRSKRTAVKNKNTNYDDDYIQPELEEIRNFESYIIEKHKFTNKKYLTKT